MSPFLLRILNVIEVLLFYHALKHKYQQKTGDPNGTKPNSQQQYQTDTCQPAQYPQQQKEQSEPPSPHC